VLKMHEMRELIKLVDQSSITDFEYEYEGLKVSMKKSPGRTISTAPSVEFEESSSVFEETKAVAPSASVAPVKVQAPEVNNEPTTDTAGLHKIESPMVGTFYASPSPDADAYVKAGDKVNDSSVVCIVEAMKLMNEIEAEVRGEIVEVLVENGQLVEYGQALFLVKPE
jgi:acetyl-CoA carboxylase biotin carboxyl carrier protein